MATYWVPDLPNIKGISGHLNHSILIFANGASYMLVGVSKYFSCSIILAVKCLLGKKKIDTKSSQNKKRLILA